MAISKQQVEKALESIYVPAQPIISGLSWLHTLSNAYYSRYELMFDGFSYGTLTVYPNGDASASTAITGSKKGHTVDVENWMIEELAAFNDKQNIVH